jgi:hypothetical protein
MSASLTVQRTDRQCRLIEWKPWPFDNPSLIGHATVAFQGGWVVSSVPVFRTANGGLSVGTPSMPQLDAEGRVKLKPDGRRDYKPVISFETAEGRGRWQRLILAALVDAGVSAAAEAAS